jgi:hypothetical protein
VAFITLIDAQKLQFELAPPGCSWPRAARAPAKTRSTPWWRASCRARGGRGRVAG